MNAVGFLSCGVLSFLYCLRMIHTLPWMRNDGGWWEFRGAAFCGYTFNKIWDVDGAQRIRVCISDRYVRGATRMERIGHCRYLVADIPQRVSVDRVTARMIHRRIGNLRTAWVWVETK